MSSQKIIVLGAGAWGTALAIHLAKQNNDVTLWGHVPEHIEKLAAARENAANLPTIKFPDNLKLSTDFTSLISEADKNTIILIVVPSHAFLGIIDQIAALNSQAPILWATKGLTGNGEFLHSICRKKLSSELPIGVLSGPSFATEVAKGLPTAVTVATDTAGFGQWIVKTFHSERFRVYLSNDMIGVQLAGAIKNVLAIATGMADGLQLGANARSAIITRGLAEAGRLGKKLNAKSDTFMGLAGVGDITLTCTDNQSRNRRFGLLLGQGLTLDEAQSQLGLLVEGKINARHVIELAKNNSIEMPICEQVYAVLYQGLSPLDALQNLMQRSPKSE